MNDPIARELASYERWLEDMGFHPKSVGAYSRKLREFLEANPHVLDTGEADAAAAINDFMGAGVAYDDHTRDASLRKWHRLRFGVRLGSKRLRPDDFRTSLQIDAEVGRLRERLESDGLTPAVVNAHCSVVGMFLGWLFPDGVVTIQAVDEAAALEFIKSEKSHLKPTSAKVEATRIARYLRLLSEEDPTRRRGLPFAPACWGASSLPRMITDEELDAILSVGSCDEVGSRNRAALLLMANMGLRCCEVVALTLDDVDFRNGTVNVAAAKCQDARTLPLEAGAGAALADYICHHRPGSTSRAVFLRNKSHRGDPMSLPQMRNSLRYQARLAGVGDFGTHMLRRRAATSMVAAGTPMKVVADVLGHAEVQTTTAYLRIDVEGLRAVAAEWPGDGRG